MSFPARVWPVLPPALAGERVELVTVAGRVSLYQSAPPPGASLPPLVLVHSVNAAGSAAEVRPLYDHYRAQRAVYALDLPGFGHSDRSARRYTPRLMTDAVRAVVTYARGRHGGAAVDALAVSLGCEFLSRAANEAPADYRSLALVSPTGFTGGRARLGPEGSVVGSARIHAALALPGLGRALFGQLTRRGVIRYFLERTWGGKAIDEALLEYDYLTTHQPGAEHAPLCFLAALLFSGDSMRLYEALRLPVWMVHGVRGDFVDYREKTRVTGRPNWSFEIMQTGALPYFELPELFVECYDRFLAGIADRAD